MLVTMLPTTAFAALWENGRVHNQEILTALENLCGSKDEAQHYYALLDEYGLLDEDGGLFPSPPPNPLSVASQRIADFSLYCNSFSLFDDRKYF